MSPSRASLDKLPHEVAEMFDDVARRYDLTNTVLTGGIDHLWRRSVARAVAARPGERVLDIAAGTGTSSEPYADRGVQVVPADFSLGMLREGYRRRPDLPFTAADAMSLPFADGSFDVVTISFGLRNVADVDAALRDFLRVVRPGGRLVVCEFSQPVVPVLSTVYDQVVLRALPAVARRVSSNPDSYVYLTETIREWPDQKALAERVRDAGWQQVRWRNLTGGIAAIHHAVAPDRPGPLS
ncbi:demethylmenaquinone methyltransferase [Ornithinimicrobium humiphilum]|uniref:Demethylmenaquinone methyltransferase n=1 Tax=Ornithinimicrobium humiphilum TaxID=125288 RepID=A0A543KRK0_9MICO|nr:demethylmenaquinone methyltransferase [Ornithinimicrobium humiphilum]TQM97703.1 demethylmenaquinone methyltransferase/2-methoxy-6-polyprenyl-1,4-benzoquinol methylase [Ornithinimicrobium humiphilum]